MDSLVPACIPEALAGNHYTERRCVSHDRPLSMCEYPFSVLMLMRRQDEIHEELDLLEPCPPRAERGAALTPAGRLRWWREHRGEADECVIGVTKSEGGSLWFCRTHKERSRPCVFAKLTNAIDNAKEKRADTE